MSRTADRMSFSGSTGHPSRGPKTALSVRTFGPNLWDVFHANGRRRPGGPADRPTTKDVRRTLSPCDAPVPVNAADRAHAERQAMPSRRLMAFVVAAYERFWGSSCSA